MEIDIANLHHAYLILGERALSENFLLSSFEEMGVREIGNPDFHAYRMKSFDIASARALRERAMEKPFGEKKIFLISAERFTPEAQNALLKTLEEPNENMHFFILLREQDLLLPTLLSRMQLVRPQLKNPVRVGAPVERVKRQDFSVADSPENFLKMSPRDRLNFSKDFADNGESLPVFLDSLLRHIHMKHAPVTVSEGGNDSNPEIFDAVFNVRRFADDPSVMPRLVLEHLSLVLK